MVAARRQRRFPPHGRCASPLRLPKRVDHLNARSGQVQVTFESMPASLVAWYRWRMTVTIGRRELLVALGGGPGGPAGEAVDCIAVLRLVQRELVPPAVDFVAATLKPVRPRDQYLTSAANLDDHSLLISDRDLDLFAGWRDHRSPPIRLAA